MVLIVILIVGSIIYFEKFNKSIAEDKIEFKEGKYSKAPELIGISGYFNTDEKLEISDLRDKVVLVDFWTYTCINCVRTLPYLIEWDRKYGDKGLVIIGVHTPEFEFEKKYENVKMAIEKYGIKYIVVQDNDYLTWSAYRNRYWPHKYVIDKEGYIRYDHIGEGAYEETEMKIQELLEELGQNVSINVSKLEDKTPRLKQTPELYSGFEFALPRGQNIGNKEGLKLGKVVDYNLSDDVKKDIIYLEGKWRSNSDHLKAEGKNVSVILNFTASAVNIVADSLEGQLELEVYINDKYANKKQAGDDLKFDGGRSYVLINEPRLYNLIIAEYDNYNLKLKTNSDNFIFNAFTFG